MNCELGRIFGETRRSLPQDARSQLVFSASSFAGCPDRVETDRLIITKSTHDYGSGYRADLLKFRARKETFQELGLLILAVVFRAGGCRTHVVLNHPKSVIKNLIVFYSGLTARASGHRTKPDRFRFSPEKIERYPWKSWASQYCAAVHLSDFYIDQHAGVRC